MTEAAGTQQSSACLRPALSWQGTEHGPEATPLPQREVIEVNDAGRGHAVFFGQEHLGAQSPNCARHGSNNDFVQTVDNFVACEYKN